MIIGFTVIFSIFASSNYLQWDCAQEIKRSSDYHRSMSIPAISILDQIKLSFQEIHMTSIQTVESDPVIEHEESHHSYDDSKNIFLDNVGKYDSLIFTKNSKSELVASEMMQREMQNYAAVYLKIIDKNDKVMEQYHNQEISSSEAVINLANIEMEFHKTIEVNSQMEIQGMEKVQEQIIIIEKRMETIFLISTIIGIITLVC